MADSKISALTDGAAPASGDLFVIARSGADYKLTWDELIAALPGVDGWINDTAETWTYASGSGGGTATFTVAGDVTAKYTPGTRIKLTQTTVKYFVVAKSVVAAGTTTVTITGGSDYTLANAAISANYHSYTANPQGYPGWFSFSPSNTGWSSTTSNSGKFSVNGRTVTVTFFVIGTSNSTSTILNLPLAATTGDFDHHAIRVEDNGTVATTPGMVEINSGVSVTTVNCYKDMAGNGWTASGAKFVEGTIIYAI